MNANNYIPSQTETEELYKLIPEIPQDCPFCGTKVSIETTNKPVRHIFYCNNDDCPVKPCTEAKGFASSAYDWSQVKKGES